MSLSKVISVIPTFFKNNYTIDYDLIFCHIENQIKNGMKDIVILGTTSEAPTLSLTEREELASFVHNRFRNNLNNIIIGLGGNNTYEMFEELTKISTYADYIMISQPSYNKPSQEGIYQHYKMLIENTNKPIIIYNIPSRCGVNIEPETIKRICDLTNRVVGIKEASGSLTQSMQIKSLCPELLIFSGDDALTYPIMSIGGYGVISVVSNIIPNQMNNIVNNYGKPGVLEKFYNILPIMNLCFIESNPVALKYLLSIKYNKEMYRVRLPLYELSTSSKEKINNFINDVTNRMKIEDRVII